MGDFVKAYPRTWRQDLLRILSEKAGLKGGGFALLADILEHDAVVMNVNGWTVALLKHGIPEGGTVGPLA